MDWQDIVQKARLIKEDFEKSYKCVNTDRPTKDETLSKHFEILYDCLDRIRVILNVHHSRLTQSHRAAAESFYSDVRSKLVNVLSRRDIDVSLPLSLHEELPKVNFKELLLGVDTNTKPQVELPTHSGSFTESVARMTQSVTEFLGLATRVIPDFDGRPENLRAFLDSLDLVESIKGTHEAVAVGVIKTKLKGTARNLISSESTVGEISRKLRSSVRGESTEVLTAKIMNVRQGNKSANAFVTEVEELTKALSSAYISDGLTCELAEKYSTQVAVKSMTKGASSDRVRLIMAAGNFGTMGDAVSKFVNSCTETSVTSNVMYYNSGWSRNNRGRGRGNNRGRGYGNRRGRGFGGYSSDGQRGRNRGNRGNRNNGGNRNRNVRVAVQDLDDSENPNRPVGGQ